MLHPSSSLTYFFLNVKKGKWGEGVELPLPRLACLTFPVLGQLHCQTQTCDGDDGQTDGLKEKIKMITL